MKTNIVTVLAGISCLITAPMTPAETVNLKQGELIISAELEKTDSFADGPVVLMTHGTLAHGKMEIMSTLQSLLKDNGVSSLAINLSLGISNRSGMYDCQMPHNHKHEDAVGEIGLWHDFLISQGAKNIVALGHSRGGNQTAQYAASKKGGNLARVVLIAPMTWNAEDEAVAYKARYKTDLSPLLAKAVELEESGKGAEEFKNIDFIYCEDTSASAASFASYYKDVTAKDTPGLLKSIKAPTLVITGSADTVVADLPARLESMGEMEGVSTVSIDGADHFFRDLYADEVIENILPFIE